MRILLTLLLTLFLTSALAEEKARIFPDQGLQVFLGLDNTSSAAIVKDGRAADIQNITLDITGAAAKRNGFAFHTLLDTNYVVDNFEAVTGLHELRKSTDVAGSYTKIATCGDKLFKITTAGAKTHIPNPTITEGGVYQFSWITALDYAIGTNGTDPPIKTNGTTSSALSFTGLSYPITKAKCVIWWKNYLILGNITENSVARTTRIRVSNVGTIETWPDDDYWDIATFGGQQIEAFATLYDNLYIFLTDSIYKISLVGGDELLLITKVSEGIGCIAKNSIQNIQIGNSEGLIFLSRDKTINYCDGVKVNEISTPISTTMDTLSSAYLPYAVSIDDQENAHYYLAVTTGANTENSLLLDFHYGIGEWSKHININANAFCVANDANEKPQIYYGDYNSFVYQMVDPDKDSDVAGETGIFDGYGAIDTATASGLTVLYDTSANFTDVTGAIVRITSGTGLDEESVICATTVSGIVVVDNTTNFTGTTGSGYSIGDIEAYYTTKWYDTGSAPLIKNFGDLFLWHTSDTSATMQVYHATDFANTITSTDVTLGAGGSLWGTAIWGTSTWAGSETALSIIPLSVSGRYIKFKFSESTIDKPMELLGYNVLLWDGSYK